MRIQLRQNVLNSKSEFSRCRLPRLVIDKSWMTESQRQLEEERHLKAELVRLGEEGEEIIGAVVNKRRQEPGEETVDEKLPGRKKRKLKHDKVEENWGRRREESEGQESDQFTAIVGITEGEREEIKRVTNTAKAQQKIKVWRGNEFIARETVKVVVERTWLSILTAMERKKMEREDEVKQLEREQECDWIRQQLNQEDMGQWDDWELIEEEIMRRESQAVGSGTEEVGRKRKVGDSESSQSSILRWVLKTRRVTAGESDWEKWEECELEKSLECVRKEERLWRAEVLKRQWRDWREPPPQIAEI